MKLPNGERAQLSQKLERYSLNMDHSKGRDKAILFKKRLGITLENKEILETALLQAAIEDEAILRQVNDYGSHYNVRFLMQTETGRSIVLSGWTIRPNEDFPRLTNAYPVNK
jgi:hypothetical protein